MKKLFLLIGLFLAIYALISVMQGHDASAAPVNCGLQLGGPVAFCDSFDAPSPVFNRSGQLNGQVWGVSRETGNGNNIGQSQFDAWAQVAMQTCSGTQTVIPPMDVQVCNGQLREAVDDNGTVTVLAMYPKQPFDFAGRTGTIAFDVSNDTEGGHTAWPELWLTDKPNPAPFAFQGGWASQPQHGFGIRFSLVNGGAPGKDCTNKWTVDSTVIIRNYAIDDEFTGSPDMATTRIDCVTRGSFAAMNHVEVRVSQNQLDVFASDAGSLALKQIATIPNVNLTLTRGLVWLLDGHYNGNKGCDYWFISSPPCIGEQVHTFAWDNVAFDGPFTYRDNANDVLDAMVNNGNGTYNLGWKTFGSGTDVMSVNTLSIDGSLIPVAASARLLFNYQVNTDVSTFTYTINGHQHVVANPLPPQGFTARTEALDVPLTDLVAGPNNVRLVGDQPMLVANVGIVLVNVSGGAPATPTPVVATPTPTIVVPTNTPIPPTATGTPQPPTVTPTGTAVPPTSTSTPAPTRQCTVHWGNTTELNFGQTTEARCHSAVLTAP